MKQAMPLALDIRLMNIASAALGAGVLLVLLGAGGAWLLRHPAFAIQAITVQGEVTRNNALTLQANVMPQLNGNFFTIDLKRTSEAFEAVPWVRSAVVHREFPNRLRTVLSEHEPMALWGPEGSNKMVNQQSRVFEANVEDAGVEGLPRLKGPDAQSAAVVQMYRHLRPQFEAADMDIEQLELTSRGSWRVLTERGALLELGQGTQAQLGLQLNVFFKTLTQVTSRYGRLPKDLASADLRYSDGYALRLRGLGTLQADGPAKR